MAESGTPTVGAPLAMPLRTLGLPGYPDARSRRERPANSLSDWTPSSWEASDRFCCLRPVTEQGESHVELLDESPWAPGAGRFDAILVPTHRPVTRLRSCIDLARETRTPLIAVCSGLAAKKEVIQLADATGIQAFALDLPLGNLLSISFATSEDGALSAANLGWTRDLSMKRNLGLVFARLLGWTKLMFLDDDIYGIGSQDATALAAALEDHSVSALLPTQYPDNSVACHAHRLGGGEQGVFASASGMGVRCDRDDLGFFPDIYNEDWFFFAEEAASHRIAKVGESRQREYDPYDSLARAVWEEFGDLLAEGLYARLDAKEGIWDVDTGYWRDFIESRRKFHRRVVDSLSHVDARKRAEAGKAAMSIRAAQDQLDRITPQLCQTFIRRWHQDLTQWRRYLADLPRLDSLKAAAKYLDIDLAAT